MFKNPYNEDIKAKMMNINRAAIRNDKKVSTKGLLNVSSTGVIGGAHPASVGRPIGGGDNSVMKVLRGVHNMAGVLNRRIGGARKASPWIEHVKKFAADHKISYRDALRNPKCKESYKKMSGGALSGGADADNTPVNTANLAVSTMPLITLVGLARGPNGSEWLQDLSPVAKQIVLRRLSEYDAVVHQLHMNELDDEGVDDDNVGAGRGGALSGGYRTKGASDKKPRKTSAWVTFVKEYAAKHNISYPCAMSQCKEEYKASKEAAKAAKPKKRLIRKKALVVEAPPVVEAPKPKKRLIRKKTIGEVPSYVTA
jgi:hypothetical protein